jgi:zinc protease
MKRRLAGVVVLTVCGLAAVFGQTLPAGVAKKASMGGITEYDFPNGLRVLLYPDPADPKITVSRIKDELVSRGASWNGTTSDDRTNYYETFTATDENLRWALGLETDRMVNVKFTKEILDTEMTVVRNEFERGENNPASILRERVASTAYLWHNYGKSTIGSKDDLEKVPVNRLAEFYRKFCQPDNAVLVITGRLDEAKTLQMVADSMGKLPRPTRVLDQTYTVEPPQDGERFVTLRRVGQGQNVMIAYHAVAAGHPDAAVLEVLAGLMNGGGGGRGGRGGGGAQEGRLAKALVDTRLAESASRGFQLQHDPGLILVSASLNQDQSLDAARDAIYKALDDVVKNAPTAEEINRVTSQLARSLENSLSNAQSIATGALNSAIAQGDWRLMFLQHDRLQDINSADVVRAAQSYLKPSNRTVGYFVPDSNPDRTVVPATPDLAETFRDYSSKVSVVRGESFDPTIANIESRVVRSRLANGMKVAVLPKKTANNMVSATIELRFGDTTTLAGQREAASLAGGLLMAGTKSHTRAQIQEELRKLNAQVTASGGGGGGGGGRGGRGVGPGGAGLSSASASISAPAENFVAALRLAVEVLKEPAYPQDDFDRVKTQRVKALEQIPTEPNQLANERLSRHL